MRSHLVQSTNTNVFYIMKVFPKPHVDHQELYDAWFPLNRNYRKDIKAIDAEYRR